MTYLLRSPTVERWSDVRRHDVAVAALVGVVQVVGTALASRHETSHRALDALAFVLLAAGPLALLARRRAPAAVLVFVFGVTTVYTLLGYSRGPVFLALVVAFFTAVTRGRRPVAWV